MAGMTLGLGIGLQRRGGGAAPVALSISGTPVLSATEGEAYAGFTATAAGGTGPYVYSLVGTWPAGISINADTGAVSGTPTQDGSFAGLSVRVTDAALATDDLDAFTLEVEDVPTDLSMRIGTGSLPAVTTGTRDVTAAGWGQTPKLALMLQATAADGSSATDSHWSMGAADGSAQWAIAAEARQLTAVARSRRAATTRSVLEVSGAGTLSRSAAFDSFISNGVRVNVTTANSNARDVKSLLFAGADLDVAVGTVSPATGGANVNVGFQPDCVIIVGHNGAIDDANQTGATGSVGFAAWSSGGSLSQAAVAHAAHATTRRRYLRSYNDAVGAEVSAADGSEVYKLTIARDATGFTLTESVSSGGDQFAYIALGGGAKFKVGTAALAASTGAQAFTGVGFQPDALLFLMTHATALGMVDNSGFGFGLVQGAVNASMAFTSLSDGVTVNGSNTATERSSYDANELKLFTNDGANSLDAVAVIDSLDADGFTLDVTDAPAGAYRWPYLAIAA